jgi:hypothetical protein
VTLENQGEATLAHLFLLKVEKGAREFIHVEKLEPKASRTLAADFSRDPFARGNIGREISAEMQRALVSEGLFEREAIAMVKTWQDSWFSESGWRVLYTLPEKWTDELLPAEINPAPAQFVRVMVGRAELIPPAVEKHLVIFINKAIQGDADPLRNSLTKLGRFSEAIFTHAVSRANPNDENRAKLFKIFQDSTRNVSARATAVEASDGKLAQVPEAAR